MLEIKGYITNLGKYNEGELVGEWITFPIDEDELEEVFERIGINEEYEEFFFTDWDGQLSSELGEYESIERLNEIAEKLNEWDKETFLAAIEIWNLSEVLENDADCYTLLSDVNTEYDLGYYWIEESGCYDVKALGHLSNYIDYESFGRDVYFESSGGFTDYGYIEYIG